jgi:hypothetical protein
MHATRPDQVKPPGCNTELERYNFFLAVLSAKSAVTTARASVQLRSGVSLRGATMTQYGERYTTVTGSVFFNALRILSVSASWNTPEIRKPLMAGSQISRP